MIKYVVYSIEEIKGDSLLCKDKERKEITVQAQKIKYENKPVSLNDITLADKLSIGYKNNNIQSVTLIKQSQKPNTGGGPNIAPNLGGGPNIVQNPARVPPRPELSTPPPEEKSISTIQPISLAPISDESKKNTLGSIFGAFRKLRPGISNLPLAFIIGVIDYCIIYQNQKILEDIKQCLGHQMQLLPDSENIFNLIGKIEQIVTGPYENSVKFMQIQELYENFPYELELLVRNLIKIEAELKHYRKEYEVFREMRPLPLLVQICNSGVFDNYDFTYILNLFKMQMRIVGVKEMDIAQMGNRCEHIIYILQLENNDYNVLYTRNEHYLQTAGKSEAVEMIQFMKGMQDAEFGEKLALIKEYDSKIEENVANVKKNMNELKNLNEISGNSNDLEYLKQIFNDQELNCLLEEYCCGNCKKLLLTAEFPCGHLLCHSCTFSTFGDGWRMCSICKLYASASEIDPQFNTNSNQ